MVDKHAIEIDESVYGGHNAYNLNPPLFRTEVVYFACVAQVFKWQDS